MKTAKGFIQCFDSCVAPAAYLDNLAWGEGPEKVANFFIFDQLRFPQHKEKMLTFGQTLQFTLDFQQTNHVKNITKIGGV